MSKREAVSSNDVLTTFKAGDLISLLLAFSDSSEFSKRFKWSFEESVDFLVILLNHSHGDELAPKVNALCDELLYPDVESIVLGGLLDVNEPIPS